MKLETFECDIRGHFKHQSECKKLVVGDLVWLIPEPDNEYDEHAIRVLNSNGKDLGYIPSEDNEDILHLLYKDGAEYCSKITKVEVFNSDGVLPRVTVYISKNKTDLPFQQESKFKLHTSIDASSGKTTYSIRGGNYKSEGIRITGQQFRTLFIGLLIGFVILVSIIITLIIK